MELEIIVLIITKFIWTFIQYSIESMELCSRRIKTHRVPLDSTELGRRHLKLHKCSLEFHGIFHRIPWNSGATK